MTTIDEIRQWQEERGWTDSAMVVLLANYLDYLGRRPGYEPVTEFLGGIADQEGPRE